MNEFDDVIGKIFRDNEERRIAYGVRLAEIEERLERAEADVLKAFEGAADHSGMGGLLRRAERLRAGANELWAEIEKPAPDWTLFDAKGVQR
ncbi:hypothetical protein L1856_07685 [Streptomyces sp. Tue 6430]|nr:hypothetical protein [Streptomyces sp. Tue 6430]